MTRFTLRACAAALVVATGLMPAALRAEGDYPVKPVKIVVGFPAGSVADLVARQVGQKASQALGQQFIVEDKPGASSNIAAEIAVRAPKDGYTLLMSTIANTINASVYPNLTFNFASDLAPIILVGSVPNALAVNPALPAHSVQELIALAKAKPGEIFFASSGNGTVTHLSGELFNLMAGVKLAHIPYKGSSDIMNDLLAGRVMVTFTPASAVLSHMQAGTLRVLATTGSTRTAVAPDLPTISESGLAGYDTSLWMGLLAPAGTPPDIVDKLARTFAQALDAPDITTQFQAESVDKIGLGPKDFAAYIQQDTEKWAKVVKTIGLKID